MAAKKITLYCGFACSSDSDSEMSQREKPHNGGVNKKKHPKGGVNKKKSPKGGVNKKKLPKGGVNKKCSSEV